MRNRRKRSIIKKLALLQILLILNYYNVSFAEDIKAQPEKQAAVNAPDAAKAEPSPQAEAPEAPEAAEAAIVEPGNVTVNFKGADIRTVLSYIAEVSGVDIVPSPDVKGPVDLKLNNKPWKVALDIIVRNYSFAYERDGDIIRVITIDKLKQEELTTQPFGLSYAKSGDVVNSIKDIVSERGKVVSDDRANVVLVTDIPTNIYKIGQVIERLDMPTRQVLIEARVIETVLNEEEKLGIDWNVKFSVAGAKRPTTFPFDQIKTPFQGKGTDGSQYFPQVQTNTQTAIQNTGGGAVGSSVVAAADFPTGYGSGPQGFPFALKDQFSFGTLDFSEFRAVLEMIKGRSNTDIVSNPRIATLDNTEAEINVGETLNLPQFERNSTTGKMEITNYKKDELGIKLKVTPRINKNDEIIVSITPEITDLLRWDQITSDLRAPVYFTRKASAQVRIKNGDTIFIGGLIKEKDVDTKRKLPFFGDILGDIPGVGLLFTKKETIKQKTELIFFITVNLIVSGEELAGVPSVNKTRPSAFNLTQEKDPAVKKKAKKRF